MPVYNSCWKTKKVIFQDTIVPAEAQEAGKVIGWTQSFKVAGLPNCNRAISFITKRIRLSFLIQFWLF